MALPRSRSITAGEILTVQRRHSDGARADRGGRPGEFAARARQSPSHFGVLFIGMVLAADYGMAISPINSADISGVLAQMRQVAKSGALPEAQAPATDFAAVLKGALTRVNDLQTDAADLSERFELGDPAASLPQVMVALEKASVSFEAVKGVRNRLLAAYQEIMNMQI